MATPEARLLAQQLAHPTDLSIRTRALSALIRDLAEPLRRFVRTKASHEHVQDICSETWEIALKHITAGDFKDYGEDPKAYIFGIASKVALRFGTRQQRQQQYEVAIDEMNEPMTEDGEVHIDSRVDVAALRRVLTEPEDLAVLDALLAEQTIPEMAQQWNCHYKTAWRRYHAFLDRSRAMLDNGSI